MLNVLTSVRRGTNLKDCNTILKSHQSRLRTGPTVFVPQLAQGLDRVAFGVGKKRRRCAVINQNSRETDGLLVLRARGSGNATGVFLRAPLCHVKASVLLIFITVKVCGQ